MSQRAVTDELNNIKTPATLTQPGIVQLNNAVDSNNETQAATPKAVKTAHDLANTANQNAGNAITNANTANQNAANANNNANTRLEKNQNGADIPDPKRFVENLGLAETVERAKNAMSKWQNGADIQNKPAFVNNLGLSELVYRTIGNGPNQIPDMSFFSAGGGYMKFPDGKMIQYGYTQSDPSGPKIINFPTPFAQECFGVTSSGTDPNAANISGCGVIDRFGFYLSAWHVGSETTNITATINRTATHISWIAIGI
ncbi:phage tail protein [Xenorhabdus bovienii]|nr:phage tail protein [Xenorhabdus bovienii]